MSLGKVNYHLRGLTQKGWLKMRNFRNSKNKLSCAYHLTPSGIEARLNATYAFLRRKAAEYDTLSAENDRLSGELDERGMPRGEPNIEA